MQDMVYKTAYSVNNGEKLCYSIKELKKYYATKINKLDWNPQSGMSFSTWAMKKMNKFTRDIFSLNATDVGNFEYCSIKVVYI